MTRMLFSAGDQAAADTNIQFAGFVHIVNALILLYIVSICYYYDTDGNIAAIVADIYPFLLFLCL